MNVLGLPLPSMSLEILAFAAALLAVFSALKKSMIPLRVVATLSTLAMCAYAFGTQNWLSAALNGSLTLVNLVRLRQMIALSHDTRGLTKSDFPYEALKAFMKSETFEPEAALFRKGETASDAYYIVSGNVDLPELEIKLGPGSLIGEMGLFSDNKARSLTAVARDTVVALQIPYHDLQELCLQNPEFGLNLFRLIVRRQVENQKRFSDR